MIDFELWVDFVVDFSLLVFGMGFELWVDFVVFIDFSLLVFGMGFGVFTMTFQMKLL